MGKCLPWWKQHDSAVGMRKKNGIRERVGQEAGERSTICKDEVWLTVSIH